MTSAEAPDPAMMILTVRSGQPSANAFCGVARLASRTTAARPLAGSPSRTGRCIETSVADCVCFARWTASGARPCLDFVSFDQPDEQFDQLVTFAIVERSEYAGLRSQQLRTDLLPLIVTASGDE